MDREYAIPTRKFRVTPYQGSADLSFEGQAAAIGKLDVYAW
jgi:hypothetical protein